MPPFTPTGPSSDPKQPGKGDKPWPINPWTLGIILLTLMWARDLWVNSAQVQAMPYSELVQHLQAEEVASLRVSSSFIEGEFKKPQADGRSASS